MCKMTKIARLFPIVRHSIQTFQESVRPWDRTDRCLSNGSPAVAIAAFVVLGGKHIGLRRAAA